MEDIKKSLGDKDKEELKDEKQVKMSMEEQK
jgi:hypothetical protein